MVSLKHREEGTIIVQCLWANELKIQAKTPHAIVKSKVKTRFQTQAYTCV